MTVGEGVDKEEEKIRDLATFVISGVFDKQVVQANNNNNTNPNNSNKSISQKNKYNSKFNAELFFKFKSILC